MISISSSLLFLFAFMTILPSKPMRQVTLAFYIISYYWGCTLAKSAHTNFLAVIIIHETEQLDRDHNDLHKTFDGLP